MAPAISSMTTVALCVETLSTPQRPRRSSARYTRADRTKAQSAPTAAASVGVKTPDQIPPSRIAGRVIGSTAPASARSTCARGSGAAAGRFMRGAISATVAIIAPASTSPGTIRPRNRAPIDVFEFSASSTMGIDGGMIGAMIAEAAVTATASPPG